MKNADLEVCKYRSCTCKFFKDGICKNDDEYAKCQLEALSELDLSEVGNMISKIKEI